MIHYLFLHVRVNIIYIFRKRRTTKEEEKNQIETGPKIPTYSKYIHPVTAVL